MFSLPKERSELYLVYVFKIVDINFCSHNIVESATLQEELI
jgi:hypothetical protein